MNASNNKRWLWAVILFGCVYTAVGISFSMLAGLSASNEGKIMWQRAAWVVSIIVFIVHIGYGHFRLVNKPLKTALNTCLSASLGAFGLAVAATIHALRINSSNMHSLFLALVLWPVMTAVPAFLVALAAAAGLARLRPKSKQRSV
jgi:hypothetical protein